MSTLKALLLSTKIKPHKVGITDYPDIAFHVRALTLGEAREFEAVAEDPNSDESTISQFLLSRCVVDEEGNPQLDDEAIDALSSGTVRELAAAIGALNNGKYDKLKKS